MIGVPVFAEFSFVDSSDFTGDAFFTPPALKEKTKNENGIGRKHSDLPLTKLRKTIKRKQKAKEAKRMQLAPTEDTSIYQSENGTSDFASKEVEEKFDENMMPDGFDADEEAVNENKKAKHFFSKDKSQKQENQANTENIVLDCDNMDYDTETYTLIATGNCNVLFVNQQTRVFADKITYDRMNNTIKAEGNVKVVKNGQTISGDYIFVDLNEESALVEKPIAKNATIEIRAQKGYVYGDKVLQENGSITVDNSFPIEFSSSEYGPRLYRMIVPKNETISEDMENGRIRVKAKEIKIDERENLEVITIKKGSVYKNGKTVIKIPGIKLYTNKNFDFAETNFWELGSIHGLGMYIGPGFTKGFARGAALKVIPILNYDHGIGVGAIGRYSSATNRTQVGYGTASSLFVVRGKQKLDDNLTLQYAVNDYLDEWWLGRRRPKYGLDLVYEKGYSSDSFLINGHKSSFSHRADLGYFHDIKEDYHYKNLNGRQLGTLRMRYMAEATQNFFSYRNEEKQKAFEFDVATQLAASLYGTGDTQVIGRVGPRLHTQYKRWMQDIGYFQSVYKDNTPIPVYDAYRYGKSNVYLREYIRLCRWLTASWFGSINLSGDSPNGDKFQENAFYISVGPDDIKFSIGYDFVRENTMFLVEVLMDPKGTRVEYDKMEIKQTKKEDKKDKEEDDVAEETNFQNSNRAPVLERASVEEIKPVEDVL